MMIFGVPQYALKEMTVAAEPRPDADPIVFVEGRKPGVMGLLLTMLGLEPICRLKVTARDITVHRTSLLGTLHQVIPIVRVASAAFSVTRPLGLIVTGAIFMLAGLIGLVRPDNESRWACLIPFAIGAVFLVFYFIGKRVVIAVESNGGGIQALAFRGALVRGKRVDVVQAEKAVLVIRDLILSDEEASSRSVAQEHPAAGSQVQLVCASCGCTRQLDARYAGRTVKCPECDQPVRIV